MNSLIIPFNNDADLAKKLVDAAYKLLSYDKDIKVDHKDENIKKIAEWVTQLIKEKISIYDVRISFDKERLKMSIDTSQLN
jgi:hypothetical protein